MDDKRRHIIDYFVKERKDKGITQKELAEFTGIDQGDISKIERGKTNVSLDTLIRLAEGLNMEIEINLIPKKEQKVYYENQEGWTKENYYYLHRFLHRMIYYNDKYKDEIEKLNLNRMTEETKVLLYCIIKYYNLEELFEKENLKKLKELKPLKYKLIIDDDPLPENNIYKQMNVIY